jgi:tRNA threonylcarbamoyladenosine biosynthesis protein TsaE
MSTVKHKHSKSAAQTEGLAERLGRALKGGEVIELVSDLGGGKTTFVRGLARGAGSEDPVASPTFTISKVYAAAQFDIHHFDFYRLDDPGIMADELAEVAGAQHAVTVIEWADVVQHVLPEKRLTVSIKQTPNGERELTFRAHDTSLRYLLEAIDA